MKKRLVVSTEDKPGLVADVSYLLAKARINIEDINVIKAGKSVIIDLLVNDEAKAKRLLEVNGYKPMRSESLLVKLNDEPGALAEVARKLSDSNIEISRVDIVSKDAESGLAILAIEVDKPKKAQEILKEWMV